MTTRSEPVEAIIERYRSSGRADKQRILDEFVAVTGCHRKHAIRVLCRPEKKPPAARQYATRYDARVREALVVLWETSIPSDRRRTPHFAAAFRDCGSRRQSLCRRAARQDPTWPPGGRI
ncbi:hypothetical protein [Microvirga sp. VF16]|uniref:hypothetical protein n=1 Tax=Microvirga sp. VF16 TaxID=2807101 RepID=UPI00193DDECA|nr:hypothetical protein [Microvirga sp. VF16]QRM33393.1 hypothetical protein JO965_25670 [Microvirga sp. VF16]